MNLWFLAPELLAELAISKDETGTFRVSSHPSDKPKRANPEEVIRQLVMIQLRCHYHYPYGRLLQEYVVQMGVTKKRADIAITDNNNNLETVIEVKQVIDDNSILQLQSYMHAAGARFGMVVSLHSRKVFMREPNGSFTQISDLPVYCGEHDTNGTTYGQLTKVDDSIAKTLMASLGITGLSRISNTVSCLYIKNKTMKLSNTSLLSYSAVRKQAIGTGIILPSTVGNGDWDNLLSLLFDTATVVEGNATTDAVRRGEELFQAFLNQICEQCDSNTETMFKEIYSAFTDWYRKNNNGNDKYLPSRKNISAQLLKNGFLSRKLGGQVYISGIRIL
ncbi:type I restriction enzyme HsdR N-terminal domain-containing protein [Geobacter hydrogenophilus]|uniref:Type I restriction enzyme R protein N-terminal domain-containing protein n=1 Tax=Geobacter hydrogenophilus TaxID=40983 RepID=A0A9W6FYY0_9BACT|nr:type I restriction enzyme HsdR N-terminal domain-containing protein [Geobacter hydrogenophilus]MBT0894702.1 type I restriction enzyme HsdR N-terminal domain-containing protein [Geobacter hydrogenophilus]GLI37461.1 hypothetical protein GHYDROH2_09620 [Geobacter hydrogenophilus]